MKRTNSVIRRVQYYQFLFNTCVQIVRLFLMLEFWFRDKSCHQVFLDTFYQRNKNHCDPIWHWHFTQDEAGHKERLSLKNHIFIKNRLSNILRYWTFIITAFQMLRYKFILHYQMTTLWSCLWLVKSLHMPQQWNLYSNFLLTSP